MQTSKVVCDQCNKNLSNTGNCEDYRILLTSQPIPGFRDSYAVTAMAISPDFPEDLHFCHIGCLKEYVASKL